MNICPRSGDLCSLALCDTATVTARNMIDEARSAAAKAASHFVETGERIHRLPNGSSLIEQGVRLTPMAPDGTPILLDRDEAQEKAIRANEIVSADYQADLAEMQSRAYIAHWLKVEDRGDGEPFDQFDSAKKVVCLAGSIALAEALLAGPREDAVYGVVMLINPQLLNPEREA